MKWPACVRALDSSAVGETLPTRAAPATVAEAGRRSRRNAPRVRLFRPALCARRGSVRLCQRCCCLASFAPLVTAAGSSCNLQEGNFPAIEARALLCSQVSLPPTGILQKEAWRAQKPEQKQRGSAQSGDARSTHSRPRVSSAPQLQVVAA